MSFYRDFKDFILSYDYDLDKNFVVSFPKTGRTWLRHMIQEMIRKSTNKLDVTFTHDHSEIITEDGVRNDTKFIFNHIRRKRYKRARVIFLVRNPKDVVVSHYHQITKRSLKPLKFSSMSSFIRDNELGFNRIIHFYNLWFKQKNEVRDFLLIKYEDMTMSSDTLFLVSEFLKLKLDKEIVNNIYNEFTSEKMRKKELRGDLNNSMSFGTELNSLKVRKAKVGTYKHEMNKDDIDYCNIKLKDLNSFYEY